MSYRNFAFISRHEPTAMQQSLANEQGIILHHVGDMDAFSVHVNEVVVALNRAIGWGEVHGVVVVHAMLALKLIPHYNVGVFENGARAAEGERPTFEPVALHVTPKAPPYEAGWWAGLTEGYDEGFEAGSAYGKACHTPI